MTNITTLLTVRDVADILRCTDRHVRNLVARCRLRPTRFGRLVRLAEKEVRRFLDDHDGNR